MRIVLIYIIYFVYGSFSFPEKGIYNLDYNPQTPFVYAWKSLNNNSDIILNIKCDSSRSVLNVRLSIKSGNCAEEFSTVNKSTIESYFDSFEYYTFNCSANKFQNEYLNGGNRLFNEEHVKLLKPKNGSGNSFHFRTEENAIYFIGLKLSCPNDCLFNAKIRIELKSLYGYLSAIEHPLLLFYSIMCAVYFIIGFFWLVMSILYWKDLLRVQIFISVLIVLGFIEKIFFVAEYAMLNKTGVSLMGGVLAAEVVSCIKRTLSRLLVMVVCIGYGIVKPRLGSTLKKVIVLGTLYFFASLFDGINRALRERFVVFVTDFWVIVPLALIDSTILFLTFSYLIETLRHLRMRKNVVKFNLYRHFSNLIIIICIVSLIFMTWSFYTFKIFRCVSRWNDLWIDEAFWHVLFSAVLIVIVWLWRPSSNNIRYAYSPILDTEKEGLLSDEEDEETLMENFTDGELRRKSKPKLTINSKANSTEEDIKWIEENIPSTAVEQVCKFNDSDEDITIRNILAEKME